MCWFQLIGCAARLVRIFWLSSPLPCDACTAVPLNPPACAEQFTAVAAALPAAQLIHTHALRFIRPHVVSWTYRGQGFQIDHADLASNSSFSLVQQFVLGRPRSHCRSRAVQALVCMMRSRPDPGHILQPQRQVARNGIAAMMLRPVKSAITCGPSALLRSGSWREFSPCISSCVSSFFLGVVALLTSTIKLLSV